MLYILSEPTCFLASLSTTSAHLMGEAARPTANLMTPDRPPTPQAVPEPALQRTEPWGSVNHCWIFGCWLVVASLLPLPLIRAGSHQAPWRLYEMFCSQRFMVVVGLLAALLVFAGVTLQGSWNVERSLSFTSVDRSVASHPTASGSSAFGDGKKEIGEVSSSSQHRGLFDRGARDGRGERRARLAFLIMSSGDDIAKLSVLLPEIYHPDNVYLVHVDAKAPREQVSVCRQRGVNDTLARSACS